MDREQAARDARRIVRELKRNADDFADDLIDWDRFGERNREIWAEAEAEPLLRAMVSALLRGDPAWREERG